jgi:hypothetical protein
MWVHYVTHLGQKFQLINSNMVSWIGSQSKNTFILLASVTWEDGGKKCVCIKWKYLEKAWEFGNSGMYILSTEEKNKAQVKLYTTVATWILMTHLSNTNSQRQHYNNHHLCFSQVITAVRERLVIWPWPKQWTSLPEKKWQIQYLNSDIWTWILRHFRLVFHTMFCLSILEMQ